VDSAFKLAPHLIGNGGSIQQVRAQAVDIAFENRLREYVRREITVSTFGPAKWDRDVQAEGHRVRLSHLSKPLFVGVNQISSRFQSTRKSMLPRVVITGMGVVSPNGIGKEAFCRAVLAGKSGVKRISRFDPSNLPVDIAGEIPEFDELAWVDPRERKHVSRVVPLCLAASSEALEDAGLAYRDMSLEEKREIGIVLGSGGGAQEYSEENYRLWHSGQVKQVSLFCIPSGTMGTISSEVQMRFGFRGYSHVVTTGCTSSTDALGYALQHIQ